MASICDPREQLVHHFDRLLDRTGSYRGVDRDARILADEVMNRPIGHPLRALFDHLKTAPGRDWILRPSVGDLWIDHEPRSLRGCVVPRDPEYPANVLPYLAYAFCKISLAFDSSTVQAELRDAPRGSKLSVSAQELVGFKTSDQAVGRTRTTSFSAVVDTDSGQMSTRLVLGLPMLATRPMWGGRYQAVVVRRRG